MAETAAPVHLNPDHRGTEFFASLEGMRGIAAMGVVLYHVFWNWHYANGTFLDHTSFFVDLFFIISGFVISHIYITRLGDARRFGEFFVLRTARLYPLHLFTLLLVTGLLVLTHWFIAHHQEFAVLANDKRLKGSPRQFLLNLGLLQVLPRSQHFTFNRPSWSISAEFFTYFVFALVVVVAASKRAWVGCIAAAIVTLAGYEIWRRGGIEVVNVRIKPLLNPSLLRCLLGFFLGVLTQLVWRAVHARVRPWFAGGWKAHLAELACVVAVYLALNHLFAHRRQLLMLLVFCVAVLLFTLSRGCVTRLLESRPIQALGRWSYSIYLNHFFVLIVFADVLRLVYHKRDAGHLMSPWGYDVVTLGFLAVVLLMSSITHRFIEVPPRTWAKDWIARRRLAASAPTA